jgi:hypothetical protein
MGHGTDDMAEGATKGLPQAIELLVGLVGLEPTTKGL